jgi:peptidoglycan-associated lipoprotein
MNKLFFLSIFLLCFSFASTAQSASANSKKPSKATVTKSSTTKAAVAKLPVQMTFKTEMIDLGKVKKGEKRSFKYEFVNTGTDALDFDIVSGCDCTTTDWPRNKVKPGASGVIDVTFDSTEKEKSETVDVDIYLRNIDAVTKRQVFKRIKYKFELVGK